MHRSTFEHAKDFADKVMVANKFEIYTSELALKLAKSEQVRSFAKQMIADHKQAGQEFEHALEEAAIEPPVEAFDVAYTEKFIELPAFSAEQGFDSSYVSQQLEAHQDAVSTFSEYAARGEIPALKAFATKTLPTLEHHLEMARTLRSRMSH
ncbi:MAG: DUF4142 domain-containing protein [Methylocystis sp.]|nr:DUF4142 domain-containing protein [Methylocystis sp.]